MRSCGPLLQHYLLLLFLSTDSTPVQALGPNVDDWLFVCLLRNLCPEMLSKISPAPPLHSSTFRTPVWVRLSFQFSTLILSNPTWHAVFLLLSFFPFVKFNLSRLSFIHPIFAFLVPISVWHCFCIGRVLLGCCSFSCCCCCFFFLNSKVQSVATLCDLITIEWAEKSKTN